MQSPRFSPAVAQLANEIELHDAIIEIARWSPQSRTLTLLLVCGDLQRGYSAVEIRYSGVELGKRSVDVLRSRAKDRESQVLYDEVDFDEEGQLVHRLLFRPEGEISIWFRELTIHSSHRADRRVQMVPFFIEEEPA